MCARRSTHQDLKRETPVIAQQGLDGVEVEHELREAAGSVLLGQMRIPWAGKGGSTCGSVASALSSGAFSVVRTRPAGKTNKVVSRQARPGASGTAHLACSSGAPTRRDPASVLLSRRHLHVPDPGQRRRQVAASGRYPPRDVFGGEAASASLTTHSAKIIPKRRKATGATYAEQHPTSSMLAVAGLHEPSLTAYRWLWLHQALGRSGRALSRPRRATGPPTSTT